MGLVAAVLSGFALAIVAPALARFGRSAVGWLMALLPLALVIYFLAQAPAVASEGALFASYPWAPGLGINFSFFLDGLGLLFAVLISGIGALIMIYAGGYLGAHPHLGRFFLYIMMFMAAMLGVVLADNIIVLYVFWELTTISSYLLIGFEHEKSSSRASAWQALLVTSLGGLAMLAGLIMLGGIGGSFELSQLIRQGEAIRNSTLYLPTLFLILAGTFTKSAQFPFHFWLPAAMAAPTPVSAYLHSATMVKAGIYLMARLSPALSGTDAWLWSVMPTGLATMLVGGYLALHQKDLKLVLAYSTVSALGAITMLLGVGSAEAAQAAIVFLLAHALYKGSLFMVAGAVDHETGTRDVDRLGGLGRFMPITASIAVLAALSLAGFGPLLSFIGKEMLFESVLHAPSGQALLVPATVLAGALFVVVAGIVGFRPFFGQERPGLGHPHEPPPSMWLGPALLAVGGLVLGVFPHFVAAYLVAPAATAIIGAPTPLQLALWHGFNTALALSGISITAGILLALLWARLHRATGWLRTLHAYGPERWYDLSVAGMNQFAAAQTRLLQNGYLPNYLITTLLVSIAAVILTFFLLPGTVIPLNWIDIRFYEWVLALLIVAAAIMAVRSRSRLAAIAGLGVVGYSVALLFMLYGAPDLAMTQLLIETLSVILFVLVFYHLPRYSIRSSAATRLRDLLIACSVGAVITLVVLAVGQVPTDQTLIQYYAENSYPRAHGRNIVNVILVDFRGIDTMGEITVLGIAGIGIFALLRLRLGRRGDE